MPFVIVLLPAMSAFVSETMELVLILSIIPVSMLAFIPTWLKHRDVQLAIMFGTGLIFILLSQFMMDHHHDILLGDISANISVAAVFFGRILVMMTGVVLLATATYRNNKHTHVCKNPHHHH